MDIEKTRYCYLAVLYLFSFFGDIFLRLHLRDLCYTRHNERLKNRDYFSFHIYIRLTLCYNVFSRGILWLKFGRVFNSSPTPSAIKRRQNRCRRQKPLFDKGFLIFKAKNLKVVYSRCQIDDFPFFAYLNFDTPVF